MIGKIIVRIGNARKINVAFIGDPAFGSKLRDIPGYRSNPEAGYGTLPNNARTISTISSLFLDTAIEYLPLYLKDWSFDDLRKELISSEYCPNTIRAYIHHNYRLVQHANKSPVDICSGDIRSYLSDNEVSNSSLNSAINAFKFYYGKVLKHNFINEIIRPKKEDHQPILLNTQEISRILSSVVNLKHKTILMMAYFLGLKVAQLVNLRIEDINFQEKKLKINGSVERNISMPEETFKILQRYVGKYKPDNWLFSGVSPGDHISVRTIQSIIRAACYVSDIPKKVTISSLRYSSAVHLMENGKKITEIQEFLGHKKSHTTKKYIYGNKRSSSE